MKSSLRKIFYFLFFLLLSVIGGCTGNLDNSNEIVSDMNLKSTEVSTHFAIVLVNGVKTGDAIKSKIEDLPLESRPVLTDKDLIFYK